MVQKTFLELYKQHKGRAYFGSLLTGVVEGMLPMMTNDRANRSTSPRARSRGAQQRRQDNDMNFPPEWRLSQSGRKKP